MWSEVENEKKERVRWRKHYAYARNTTHTNTHTHTHIESQLFSFHIPFDITILCRTHNFAYSLRFFCYLALYFLVAVIISSPVSRQISFSFYSYIPLLEEFAYNLLCQFWFSLRLLPLVIQTQFLHGIFFICRLCVWVRARQNYPWMVSKANWKK